MISTPSNDLPEPAYRIQTPRLVLRCWQPTDISLLMAAIAESLDHLKPWMPWAHQEPQTLQQRLVWMRQARGEFDLSQNFVYGIFNLDETLVLGGSGMHPKVGDNALEIGYWIHVDHVGQGLATETAAALTKVAFEVHHMERVEIHCLPTNLKSAAVPQKLGFSHEATLRQRVADHEGQKHDSMIWSLFAADYPTSPAAQAEITAFDAIRNQLL